jgi:peptidoglycan/LPS O-acetylase OafA/YrhL
MRHKSYIALDLLRAGAAIAVLLTHARGFTWVEYAALPPSQHTLTVQAFFFLTRVAHEAVLVFFVLSGALVGGQIIRRTIEGRFSVSDYAIDRVTRIFIPLIPAYIVAVIVQSFVLHAPPSLASFIANVTGLNGAFAPTIEADVPLWSLAYEIWFYVLGGSLALILTKPSAAAFAAMFAALAVFSVLDATLLLYWTMGALVVLLKTPARDSRFLAIVGTLLAAIGCITYELSSGSHSFAQFTFLPGHIPQFLLCAGVTLTLPFLHSDDVQKRLARLEKPASFLAGMSYTLYLMHYPTLYVLSLVMPKSDHIDITSLSFFLLRAGICFLVARLFYLLFEKNTDAARQWFRRIRQ